MNNIAERIEKPCCSNCSNFERKIINKQEEFIRMFISEVKEEMKHQKMTQIKMANIMGAKRGSISNILRGKVNPSMLTVKKMADALGMKIILCLGERE